MIDRLMAAECGKGARAPASAISRFGSFPLRIAALAAILMIAATVCPACNDPYSQRRIDRRWADFDETAKDIAHREADGARRLDDADQTLKKWWQADTKRFQERVPTIGDYFW